MEHSHHIHTCYMTSSDNGVTCVPWGINCVPNRDTPTGLRLISTRDTVCVTWLQTWCWMCFLFSRKQKKGVPKMINRWLPRQHNSHDHVLSFSCAWTHHTDPWTGLRLCSCLKHVLWHVSDPLTTWIYNKNNQNAVHKSSKCLHRSIFWDI